MSINEHTDSARLFVGGLYTDEAVQKDDLRAVFEPFGAVSDVWVARDPPGYAFIELDSPESARTAMLELNNTEALGTVIRSVLD